MMIAKVGAGDQNTKRKKPENIVKTQERQQLSQHEIFGVHPDFPPQGFISQKNCQ